ncbi:hypothetical protein RRF57_012108 [Xylaria bambusicola]|uniref:Uncharacterized protein n=1 Tax=Xylaria bambusicola TaxID=326684 RepID=A0AAN7ZAF6_9PEZI
MSCIGLQPVAMFVDGRLAADAALRTCNRDGCSINMIVHEYLSAFRNFVSQNLRIYNSLTQVALGNTSKSNNLLTCRVKVRDISF